MRPWRSSARRRRTTTTPSARCAARSRSGTRSGELEGELQVRIGVNTGEVVGGTGGPQEGDYTVSGDAVNVAARLQQAAEPGEILVGGMTRKLSAEAFAFAPLDEMALKGRDRGDRGVAPRARAAGAAAHARRRGSPRGPLARARLARFGAGGGPGGPGLMVALVGEPGIGKSRLALEMRQRAEDNGFVSAWTSSRSYASAFPYHLLSQLVAQLLDRRPGQPTADALARDRVEVDEATLGRWAAVLDDVLGEGSEDDPVLADLSPSGRQRILVHAIGGLLRAASQRDPMLVVLDDLHWADPTSLAVDRGAAGHPARAAGRAACDVPLQLVPRLGRAQRLRAAQPARTADGGRAPHGPGAGRRPRRVAAS